MSQDVFEDWVARRELVMFILCFVPVDVLFFLSLVVIHCDQPGCSALWIR
jgi:hypothetical protein